MKYIVLAGRFLYSLVFFLTIVNHFSLDAINAARFAGIPAANYLVPISGMLAVLGSLSIMIGYKAKARAWLIVIFLIPVTFVMHPFWREGDMLQSELQLAMFAKNISLLGAALMISYFGSGPLSLDEELKVRVSRARGKKSNRFLYSTASPELIKAQLRRYV